MEHGGKKSEETSITVVVRFKEEKDAANVRIFTFLGDNS